MRYSPIESLDPKKVFYFFHPEVNGIYSVTPAGIVIHHDFIASLNQYQLVVADFSTEHWGENSGVINMAYDLLDNAKLNFVVLSHDINDHLARPRLLFYPHWYYQSRAWFPEIYKETITNVKKTFNLSCLNGVPRFNRIYNFLKLKDKPYFNQLLFSMFNDQNSGIIGRADDYELDPAIISQWNNVKGTLAGRNTTFTFNNQTPDHDIQSPAYTDSYINLVTETTVIPRLFVTEKTWKPIASGQLFLVIGSVGTIKYLRDQGVDTFDDIIDHNYYDTESDWRTRITRVHELIDWLMTQDLYQLNLQTQQRRLTNAQRYFAGEFDQKYHMRLLKCINMPN